MVPFTQSEDYNANLTYERDKCIGNDDSHVRLDNRSNVKIEPFRVHRLGRLGLYVCRPYNLAWESFNLIEQLPPSLQPSDEL